MRSQFTFYKSFDDVIEDMTDKQIVEYVKAVLDVQFLRKRISEISFDDKVLSMVWKSQKHSITSSIDGYLNSQKKEGVQNPYFGAYATPSEGGFFTPSNDPYEGGRQQEEEKGKVKEKEKWEVQEKVKLLKTYEKESDFSLQHDTHYDNLSKEYKEALQVFIESMGLSYPFDDFVNSLQAKASYKYKNFVKTYRAWAKNHIPKQAPQQRMDISKLPEGVSLQDMLNEAGEQWEREQEQEQKLLGVQK